MGGWTRYHPAPSHTLALTLLPMRAREKTRTDAFGPIRLGQFDSERPIATHNARTTPVAQVLFIAVRGERSPLGGTPLSGMSTARTTNKKKCG